MTRTASAHLFSSLNGVSENPHLFQFDRFGEEEGALMGASLAGVTDVVIGRVLWEQWSEYWQSPEADDGFGDFINPVAKHVVSSTLSGDLGWNSTVIDGDPVAYVQALKAEGEGKIAVTGGLETVRSLFLAGAIDTLTLTIHPAITGEGRRLFPDGTDLTRVELVDSTVTSMGNAVLTYQLLES